MEQDYIFTDNPVSTTPDAMPTKKIARRTVSRIMLALFFYTLTSYVAVYAAEIILAIVNPDLYVEIAESAVFNLILSSVSMYLIAFPIFYFTVRKMPVHRPEKTHLGIGQIAVSLLIAELAMLVGNAIGQYLSMLISLFAGEAPPNTTIDLVTSLPPWVMILFAVVIGPIVEELIFRRLIIDRLSMHGDGFAVIVSAVAFGVFHQNLYQLFYATLLGVILGYLYVKTRNVIYPIILHVIFNFLGSVVALYVSERLLVVTEIIEEYGVNVPAERIAEFLGSAAIVALYSLTVYGAAIAGAVILIIGLIKKKFRLSSECPMPLKAGESTSAALTGVGAILFLVISLIMTAANIVLPLITG